MRETEWRLLFLLSVAWGASIFWLAPHPPMIDLPQHAAQVSLLRDMLLGQSPWSDLFRINVFTPYVIGYGLALPLSLALPPAAALKLLLSLAYIAFVFMCVTLRRHFRSDARLDWLFLPGFFGFAYKWGFLTFLVAAPIGLWFILLSDRYAHRRTPGRAAGVIAVGLLLLASHGLVFLFAWCVGGALVAARTRSLRLLSIAAAPYAILALACAGYFLVSREVSAGMQSGLQSGIAFGSGWLRLPEALLYAVAVNAQGASLLLLAAVVIAMALVPWLLGLRIDWRNKSSLLPFAAVACVLAFVPNFAFSTGFLYQRFALFLAPAYAWMFTRAPVKPRPGAGLALPILLIACWSTLGLNTVRAWRFGQETADVDAIMATLEPRHRALALVFDRDSEADNNKRIYLHYPSWYQAEKQGLVDFNFAWFPPQVVRYRPEHLPAVAPGFEWWPEGFDWKKNRGGDYRYFFVRHAGAVPQNLFRGADCPPVSLLRRGSWTIYERRSCP